MIHCEVIFVLLACCTLAAQSYYLPRRAALTPRDIRLRCCHNQWRMCCKRFPWEDEEDDGSTVGSTVDLMEDGSGITMNHSKPLTDKAYCRRFSTPFYGNYYGDKCVNNYIIFMDLRQTRNIIEEYHRCVPRKDPEFLNRLIDLENELRPDGERCCSKHEAEGMIYGVFYSRAKIEQDLAALQKEFERQMMNRRAPCYIHGHSVSIEDRMAELVFNMGYYIKCAEELECPLLPPRFL